MAQLQELGLNRMLYKDPNTNGIDYSLIGTGQGINLSDIDQSLFLSQQNTTNLGADGGGGIGGSATDSSSGSGAGGAAQVLTGTVITSCVLQSSNSENRIEIASSFNLNGTNFQDEALVAYNAGAIGVLIDGAGIFAIAIRAEVLKILQTIQILSGASLDVLSGAFFNYQGRQQPVIYYGRVKYDGVGAILPTGWIITHLGVGQYRITHNLGILVYTINITDLSEPGGPASIITWSTEFVNNNSFDAISFDASGNPTDSSFFFTVFKQPT